ncbi:MAG: hypothetical protein RL302_1309 [Pseudomonadota bacterium]|jgi:hypothetical protein
MPVQTRLFITLALSLVAGACPAQGLPAKPTIAHYWMDVSTVSMANATEQPRRSIDIAVANQRRPDGAQVIQAIPLGQGMGGSLTLLPVPATPATATATASNLDIPPRPKGRLLLYWGCGETVRAGQPQVLDLTNATAQDYARTMAGRGSRQSGATAAPGHAIWPNAEHPQSVPPNASLVGKHAVVGDGLPSILRFELSAAQDLMPPMALTSIASTTKGNATTIGWPAIASAQAYFLNALGTNDDDMVVWSSSEVAEPGWGLMGYLGNAQRDQWLAGKVLLPATQTQCALPAGIFAKTDGALVQGIAYGQEFNKTWGADWTVQIRVKSVGLLPLEPSATKMPAQKPLTPAIPGMPNLMPNLGGALKGLFGR